MSSLIKVDLGARSYDIHVGTDNLKDLGGLCAGLGLGKRCLVVSDTHVDPLYGAAAQASLEAAGFIAARAVVPAGELSKSEVRLFQLYEQALAEGLDRSSFVVALGGGVVGDLAGFMAATFLRGIRLVQVPTSLLAMVDSAVGGKTGINLAEGKNLVGAFHQPALVVADMATLKTLPPREFLSGLAEVVKYGMIRDAALFDRLEAHVEPLLVGDAAFLESVVARSCEIKAEVVRLDEREGGLRAILNFGHTVGHAVEKTVGYGKYLHGEAVALGMVWAARVSVWEKHFPERDSKRLRSLLHKLGLSIDKPDVPWDEVRRAMGVDKKTSGRVPRFVLLEAIGRAVTGCEVPEDVQAAAWRQCRGQGTEGTEGGGHVSRK